MITDKCLTHVQLNHKKGLRPMALTQPSHAMTNYGQMLDKVWIMSAEPLYEGINLQLYSFQDPSVMENLLAALLSHGHCNCIKVPAKLNLNHCPMAHPLPVASPLPWPTHRLWPAHTRGLPIDWAHFQGWTKAGHKHDVHLTFVQHLSKP